MVVIKEIIPKTDWEEFLGETGDVSFTRNVHPTRLKYQKTKWQKDRDECMELADKNAKGSIFIHRAIKNTIEYYRNCLKERGY
jgi:hypothetical protein